MQRRDDRGMPRRSAAAAFAAVLLVSGAAAAEVPVAGPDGAAAETVAQIDANPDTAVIDEVTTAEDLEEDEGDTGSLLPFSVSGSMSTSFSLGSISRDNYTTTDSVLANFGLSLSYPITSMVSASMSMGLSKYLTPHGSTRQYESRFADIGLGLSHSSLYTIPVAEVNISGGVDASIPTSQTSRFTGLRTSIGANLGLSRSFGDVTLSYTLGANKNFHRATSVVFNNDRYDVDVLLRQDDVSRVSDALVALDTGVLGEWSVANSLNLGYRFWDTGLSASLGFTLSDSFTYAADAIMEDDEFTSEFAEPGRGHSQVMIGSIGLGYRFLDHFSTGISMSTAQQPKSADNTSVRFPFFDTQTGNLSSTSLAIRFGVSY